MNPVQSNAGSAPLHASLPAAVAALRWPRKPNPIWVRELRQSARLGRTPWVLLAITLAIGLLICSIGGLGAETTSPGEVGEVLYQVFFSLAAAVVAVVGPGVAANAIASEREGRTWEAILLTAVPASTVARGKFLAAFSGIALYIVALAPIGAVSFLFGGVTAFEVVAGFGFLFAFAALCVTFGLAVSSLMKSTRGAIVVTLLLAICIAPMLYGFFGVGGSVAVHSIWHGIKEGPPIWLPLAFTRAEFGAEYVFLLVVSPLVLFGAPSWLLYELTVVNLSDDAEDKSTRIKRWFFGTFALLVTLGPLPAFLVEPDRGRATAALLALLGFSAYLLFVAFLFAGEPLFPSRRIRILADRANASWLTRFMGPGLVQTQLSVMVLGAVGLSLLGLLGAVAARQDNDKAMCLVAYAMYAAPYFVFVVGLITWLRGRGLASWVVRLIAGAVLFVIAVVPWVGAAIVGILSRGSGSDDEWLIIGSPSPFYIGVMFESIGRNRPNSTMIIGAGVAMAALYFVVGIAFMAAGTHAARTRRDAQLALEADLDRALASEAAAEAQGA